jgi:hypothetical protein
LDDNKKPGQRDISDLKARLGLKKTAAMPAASPQAGQPAPVAGQPASSGAPSSIPSPFGQPQQPAAQPAPQPPPDPRRDPFATAQAANLAAFYGIGGQALPGDASGVDAKPISKPKPWGRLAVYAVAGAVVFGVGSSCGAIYKSRVEFNKTIDQSAQIRDEVIATGKQTEKIREAITGNREKGIAGIAEAMGGLDLKKPDQQKLFRTNYKELEDVAVDRLMSYYNHTILLYDLVRQHASRTDNDKDAIKRGLDAAARGTNKRYAVVVKQQGGLNVATFAELGAATCGAGKEDCQPADISGFKYRTDANQSWGERPLKGAVYAVIVPMEPSPLFATVAAGNPDVLAARDAEGRMKNILDLLSILAAEEKEVKKDMERAAGRQRVFTF